MHEENILNLEDELDFHDIVLRGGPPWGFTLTGGSEFGTMVYVNTVSDAVKTVFGSLLSGDQILSINGVCCASRSNAIQMVRCSEDELKLKIYRDNIGGTKENLCSNEKQNIVTHSGDNHHSIDDNMNELSKSYFGLKEKSMNPPWNYKIISINKDQNTNEHSIRIGIKNDAKPKRTDNYIESVDNVWKPPQESGGQVSHYINSTPAASPRQRFKLKMMPNTVGEVKVTKSTAKSYSIDESKLVCPDNNRENVEAEPLKTVSTARAMFENMSTSSKRLKDITKAKSHMQSWNSSSLLESSDIEKPKSTLPVKHVKPIHEYSKSLPVDISKKEYEKVIINCEQVEPTVGNNKQIKDFVERPKSAFSYDDKKSTVKTDARNVNSCYGDNNTLYSEINHNYLTLEQQMAGSPSYSSEDLRHNGKDESRPRVGSHACSKNDSANELRQAASKYHQDVMKNFPKFRNTITGKDNKFSTRKASMPTEEPFARGESTRATVAMASNVRMPRSYSTNDTLEIQDLQDVLLKSNDNSMMSRLLRDQTNPTSLVKIEEEKKCTNNYKVVLRSNHLDNLEKSFEENVQSSEENDKNKQHIGISTSTSSLVAPGTKSLSIQTDVGNSSNETIRSPKLKYKSRAPMESGGNNVKPPSTKSLEEMINEISILAVEQAKKTNDKSNDLKPLSNKKNNEPIIPSNNNVVTVENKSSLYTHVETDIDSEEASAIIHRKEASADSAVYVMDNHEISHVKALSNESTDSIPEYSDFSFKQHVFNEHFLHTPTDEILQYDCHGDFTNEREKPQRTINRRKKDSSLVSSRNNSCVSTDSTTSTATIDSGIVLRADTSPRTSPLSNDSYYNKDLSGSRETLDDDVGALSDESHLISTPDRNEQAKNAGYQLMGQSYGSSLNQTPITSGENSRRHSLHSPRSGDLDNEKAKLVGSMREKINELRDQEQEIADEIKMNEELGKKVMNMVKIKATQNEFSKFELFIGELNKIVALLLSLTQRLHRYELTLQDLDMSDEADQVKKVDLISKIDKLKSQHEEACDLRDVNDKRGDTVASFLEKYCTEEEFADFQYYVDMKSQLALMQSEIREKVKLGEERLKALELTSSDWGFK